MNEFELHSKGHESHPLLLTPELSHPRLVLPKMNPSFERGLHFSYLDSRHPVAGIANVFFERIQQSKLRRKGIPLEDLVGLEGLGQVERSDH